MGPFFVFIFRVFMATIGELLDQGSGMLAHRVTARLDCELVLTFVLGLSKEQLFCSNDRAVGDDDRQRFFDFVDQVRRGRPVSYITYEKEFYGRKFYVDERVLIPRPETEMLVEQGIELSKRCGNNVRILDVGTGSGCIGLSLACELPESHVTVSDISTDALDVVNKNIDQYGLNGRVDSVKSDLLSNFIDREFDIILANLPYIGRERFHFVATDVDAYEPHVALYGGCDGLELYKKMFQQVLDLRYCPKYLLGEFGFAQSDEMRSMLNMFFKNNSARIDILPDLAGIDRIFVVSFS